MVVLRKNIDNRCFRREEQRVELYSAERKENGFYSEDKLCTCASKQRQQRTPPTPPIKLKGELPCDPDSGWFIHRGNETNIEQMCQQLFSLWPCSQSSRYLSCCCLYETCVRSNQLKHLSWREGKYCELWLLRERETLLPQWINI